MLCFNNRFVESNERTDPNKNSQEYVEPLKIELWKAKEEWDNARSFFNQVAEPDLVDYAIFEMEAAERKYMQLLKIIKKELGYVQVEAEVSIEEETKVINEGSGKLEDSEWGGKED